MFGELCDRVKDNEFPALQLPHLKPLEFTFLLQNLFYQVIFGHRSLFPFVAHWFSEEENMSVNS